MEPVGKDDNILTTDRLTDWVKSLDSQHELLSLLSLDELLTLSLVCSRTYRAVQNPLYNFINLYTFDALQKLARSLQHPVNIANLGGSITKPVSQLLIVFDRTEKGPRAVSLSIILRWIVSVCPKIEISLVLRNKFCHEQPMASFTAEFFPKVGYLQLSPLNRAEFGIREMLSSIEDLFSSDPRDTGTSSSGLRQSTLQVLPRLRGRIHATHSSVFCRPEVGFWRSLLDGHSFPELRVLSMDHEPLTEGELHLREPQLRSTVPIEPRDVEGLKRLLFFNVSNCPELNDSVLIATLPWTVTLKSLRLFRNRALTYAGISRLLHHNLPNLSFFELEIDERDSSAAASFNNFSRGRNMRLHPHLCPLLRRFCKDVKEVVLTMPHMCHDIILTELRCRALPLVAEKMGKGKNETLADALRGIRQILDAHDPTNKDDIKPTAKEGWARAYTISLGDCRGSDETMIDWALFAGSSYQYITWIISSKPENYLYLLFSDSETLRRYPYTERGLLTRRYVHKN